MMTEDSFMVAQPGCTLANVVVNRPLEGRTPPIISGTPSGHSRSYPFGHFRVSQMSDNTAQYTHSAVGYIYTHVQNYVRQCRYQIAATDTMRVFDGVAMGEVKDGNWWVLP